MHPGALGATVMPEALKRQRESEAAGAGEATAAEPAAREPSERARRSLAFPIAAVVALALAIDEDPPPPQQPSSLPVEDVASGPLAVKVPAGYAPLDAVPEFPGLELAGATAQGRGDRAVAIGTVDAVDSTLLPGTLVRALGGEGEVPDPTAVSLGPDEVEAYKYAGLHGEDADRAMTLYVSPNSKGVAAVACLSPPADAEAFGVECEGVADTLRVSGGKAFGVGPDGAYGKRLEKTFGTLDRRVAKGLKALKRDSAQFGQQAKAASDIRAAYGQAARTLRKADVSPADASVNAALAGALKDAADTWKKAASEARQKDKAGFERATRVIPQTERRLQRALTGLKDAGYKLSR
jgi:hypothetical protein